MSKVKYKEITSNISGYKVFQSICKDCGEVLGGSCENTLEWAMVRLPTHCNSCEMLQMRVNYETRYMEWL